MADVAEFVVMHMAMRLYPSALLRLHCSWSWLRESLGLSKRSEGHGPANQGKWSIHGYSTLPRHHQP